MTTMSHCLLYKGLRRFVSFRDIYYLAMKIFQFNHLSVPIILALHLQVYGISMPGFSTTHLAPSPRTPGSSNGTWGSWSSWTTTSQRERVCLSGICAGDSIETTDSCLDPTWPTQPSCQAWTSWQPCSRGSSCDFQREKCCEGCSRMTCNGGKFSHTLEIYPHL